MDVLQQLLLQPFLQHWLLLSYPAACMAFTAHKPTASTSSQLTCHGAVDLEGGDVEQPPLQRVGLRHEQMQARETASAQQPWNDVTCRQPAAAVAEHSATRVHRPRMHCPPVRTSPAHHGGAERLLVGARRLAGGILISLRTAASARQRGWRAGAAADGGRVPPAALTAASSSKMYAGCTHFHIMLRFWSP